MIALETSPALPAGGGALQFVCFFILFDVNVILERGGSLESLIETPPGSCGFICYHSSARGSVLTDIPKFLTQHTIYYSWEGNPVNISCEVMSNPPATMLWRRERFTISTEGTANTRVHSTEGKSVLEVR